MQRNIFTYILRYSLRQQLVILALTLTALPFYYASLDLPKRIINQAIDAEPDRFPRGVEAFGRTIGSFSQLEWLVLLCATFLLLVLFNGAFKYTINVYKGLVGERMLRRLRYQLVERILRFPLARFRRMSSGEMVPIVASEVEPLGGFIGDAYSLPLYQGGLLLTSIGFIFAQDVLMGLAVIALYPVQIAVIPRLQTQVNQLNKQRVREIRKLSNRITETVDTVREIRLNRTARYELAGFSGAFGRLFDIRYRIFHKKFFVKFLNNFLLQVTPFLFFLLGGYLVIGNRMSLGGLVAVLAAYKEMTPPWRELLGYYQDQQDASVRYEQIVAQFDVANLEPETALDAAGRDAATLPPGALAVSGVSCFEDGAPRLKDIGFTLRTDEHVAIVGDENSGRDLLARVLAGLATPAQGRITIADRALHDIPAGSFARHVAYVDGEPGFRSGSVLENMVYGLKRFPRAARDGGAAGEAEKTGNSSDDPDANWIDYEAMGVSGDADMGAAAIAALELAGLQDALIGFGLRAQIDPAAEPEIAACVLELRQRLAGHLAENALSSCIEPFDEASFNDSLTIGRNLLFGAPTGLGLDPRHMADSRQIRRLLRRFKLADRLIGVGHAVACRVLAQSAAGVSDDDICRILPVDAEDIARLKLIAGLADAEGPGKLSRKDRQLLESVGLNLNPAYHADPVIDDATKRDIVAARHELREALPESLASAVNFFDRRRFIPELTIRENIIFGEITPAHAGAANRVNEAILAAIEDSDARPALLRAALHFDIGRGGAALEAAERQRLAIARALLKRPQLLILNGATSEIDPATKAALFRSLRSAQRGKQLVYCTADRSLARLFERIIALRNGAIESDQENGEAAAPPSPADAEPPAAAG